MAPIAQPGKIIVTDQNGNRILELTDAAAVERLTAFLNDQRRHKPWRTHDPEPIADVVYHLCRSARVESTFGTQTRLFIADGHDTPAQPDDVDKLLALAGLDRTLFTRVPLQQSHTTVTCR